MPERQGTQTVLPQSPLFRCPNATAKRKRRLEQRMNCHSRNIPGICLYIPGIYQIQERGQAAGSDSNPGPLAFYRGQALCLQLSLTSTRITAVFLLRCTHYSIFNPLDLFNQSRVEDDKGGPVLPCKPERRKKPRRNRLGNMRQIPQMTTTKQLKKRHRNSERMNASADWHKPMLTAK